MRPGERPQLAALHTLQRQLRAAQPDIVHTWLYHADLAGLLAARLAGQPRVIWNIRCSSLDASERRLPLRLLQRTLAALSGWPSAVVTNSVEGRRAHEALGYHPRAWSLIPNGIDTGTFRPDPEARARARAEFGLPGDAIVVGIVGRAHPMKDHASFLHAASLLTANDARVRFVMVGRDVDQEPGLAAMAAAIGPGRVVFAGERQDVQAQLAAMDILVSSSAWGEGFPNAIAEAMSCGVPVVTTDVGDSAAIVGTAGLVVKPQDGEAIATALASLLALGEDARRELGTRARARIESEYSLTTAATSYRRLYEQVAAGLAT
jgi:glycosyltransferase involved in cell wall biosynthesis